METPAIKPHAQKNSLERYGIDRWGREFLRVNERGNLVFAAPDAPPVDMHQLAEALLGRGIRSPFVVRFPSMIVQQMRRLTQAFAKACQDNAFAGAHQGVYPLKVNQRRAVVDTVVAQREALHYGLEAGSKPELLLAMAQEPKPGSLLLLNGFKDHEFIRMAFHAAELGHEVIVVLESTREVRRFLDVLGEETWIRVPNVGTRAKLYTRGSGRWQSSGGESSKFGLTTAEILAVADELRAAGQLERLTLLHFHIGSQITQIKRIKKAVREAARVYASLQANHCPNLRFLDLGGGIGVDYDGSRTSYSSSVNYTIEEYASQVVYEVNAVVEETGTQAPIIVTESGRVVVASHAVAVADLREVQGDLLPVPEPTEDDNRLVAALRDTLEYISTKNYEEYYHDALDLRDEILNEFAGGHASIEDRAAAEVLFQRIRLKTERLVEQIAKPSEEIVESVQRAHHKYLANFSIFQSIPDAWSVDHVFPAAPLSRHGERTTVQASIVDITCDSDGKVASFAHPDENMHDLPLHEHRDPAENYFLGFFLTGAYQDSLGNHHNLFGRCHEVIVRGEDDESLLPGSERIEFEEAGYWVEVKMGSTNEDVMGVMDFDVEHMLVQLRDRHLHGETTLGKSWALGLLQSYPYLSR